MTGTSRPFDKSAFCLAIVFTLAARSLHAQIVADGATNTLSNVTNTFTGDMTVGTNGTFTLLVLSDNSLLTNSANGLIGRNATAKSNEVRLASATARWLMGGPLMVGSNGSFNRLTISNGGNVRASHSWVALNASSSNNVAWVTGVGSTWTNLGELRMGYGGSGNQMIVSNAGVVVSSNGFVGSDPGANGNAMIISGAGSEWRAHDMYVGNNGTSNLLVVEGSGRVTNRNGYIGYTGAGNAAWVTGTNSLWSQAGGLAVGIFGARNRMIVTNAGTVRVSGNGAIGLNTGANSNSITLTDAGTLWQVASNAYVGSNGSFSILIVSNNATAFANQWLVGAEVGSSNNRVIVDGGTLRATNVTGTALLDVRRGTNVLKSGLIELDQLLATNLQGRFEFNGGTLAVGSSTVTNGQLFRVSDGNTFATLRLTGNGTHRFGNGLSIAAHGTLAGSGSISGTLSVSNGATLSPGASAGRIVLSNSPSLQGSTVMEISRNGATLTNDQIQVTGALTYGGLLTVSDVGPTALAAGDIFQLFAASSYAGSFSIMSLPSLEPGLSWQNNLLLDGTIEVAFQAVVTTNATVRVMAANLSSGNAQRYETAGLNILQGLAPDIVAMQEFNVSNSFGINTPAALSNMVATTFGAGFSFMRETNAYSIPNGIISRYPMLASGEWIDSDAGINDRGFAWARIDLPGANDLYVVSVHLKASSGATNEFRRNAEAIELKGLITSNFPANAWVIVAGDMNLFSDTEAAIVTFKTFLADAPIPADQNGDVDTNAGRNERYDRVLPSFAMTNTSIPLVMPSRTYTNGLVFDSRIYTPLAEVPPIQSTDSGAVNMQHMAVVKVFNVPVTITNISPGPGDRYWTNIAGGNYQVDPNWRPNLVAGPQDSANFTNNASYQVSWTADALAVNAFFNARSGSVTQAVGAFTWSLTNSYIIGRDSTTTAAVTHVSGALCVTNSAGDARLVIGGSGRGTFNLNGGDVMADQLWVTNNTTASTNSVFNFNFGNLTTLQSTVVTQNTSFVVGNVSNQTATWTIPRGTNVIGVDDASQTVLGNAPGSRGIVVASGNSTVWSNSGSLVIGGSGSASRMNVSDGASVVCTFGSIGGVNSTSNSVWVTDAGSRWLTSGNVDVGASGVNNLLVISNGGLVAATAPGVFGVIGNGPAANNNLAIVTGSGSAWSSTADLYVGISGSGNRLRVESGSSAVSDGGIVGFSAGATNNVAWITDVGSVWTNNASLQMGFFASDNLLVITNGGRVVSSGGIFGSQPGSRGNQALLTGSNSVWESSANITLGVNGASSQLLITNGAAIFSASGTLGSAAGSTNNLAIVTGSGSVWSNVTSVSVGSSGSANRLVISDGGWVLDQFGFVGLLAASSNNTAMVTGAGTLWSNTFTFGVGQAGSGNTLIVSNGAMVAVGQQFLTGTFASSTNNRVIVDGGAVLAADGFGSGVVDVRRGTNVLNAGLVETDRLLLTNAQGFFEFNGGTLRTAGSIVSNGLVFVVGNGSTAATLELTGAGTNTFTAGLLLASNALLRGSGTILGNVTNASGGTVAPGASVGRLDVSGRLSFASGSAGSFEINKTAATNDNIVVASNVVYGGTLLVTNLAGTLTNGDAFKLFSASSYSGSFSSLQLPALGPGLSWKNDLRIDGTLRVVITPDRSFGVDVSHFQNESGIPQSTWDQMFAEGKRFVFIKATEGLTGPHDPTMSNNVTRAVAAGLLAGVYHFAHPENRPTTDGAIQEASNMVVYAGSAIGPGRLRPVLDLEGSAATLSTTTLTDWAIAFSDEIIARRGPGAAPIIYCSQSFANNEFDSRLASYDLWIRTVNSGVDVTVDDPPGQGFADATGVFNNWSFWQYSATGSSGGISPLDLDVCHSEFKPLSAYIIPGVPSEPLQITGFTFVGGSTFQFSFTNAPGAVFTTLATTNIALPLSNWTVLGSVPEISPGQFQFTDTNAPAFPLRYYRLRWP